MATYSSTDIKCPFYINDNPQTCKLTCEGIPPGSTIANHFLNGKAMHTHIERRCAGDYKACPWYSVLWNGKYSMAERY